jgi:SAM-dependent methyltransferase
MSVLGQSRRAVQRLLGVQTISLRLDQIEQRMLESQDDLWSRSRTRWRDASPTPALTWDKPLAGDAFVGKVASYGGFGPEKRVLEIGPGYGRLLKACLDAAVPFKAYCGVDISATNVTYLQSHFGLSSISFVQGDAEKVELDRTFDLMLSSLTLKHFFPSFEAALQNLSRFLSPGALLAFDLIEGHKRYFELDGVTYIRWYSKAEVDDILGRLELTRVAFDVVEHAPGYSRLLVVARRP